jgi:hypothetical protein
VGARYVCASWRSGGHGAVVVTAVRTWAVLSITYLVAVLSIRLLVLGAFVLDGPTVAALIAVPAVQALLIVGVRAWRRRAS